LVYANINILGENINIVKKNTDVLLDAGNVVGLEVNTEKTKYVFISHHEVEGQNHTECNRIQRTALKIY
jgi:hypothetical protein